MTLRKIAMRMVPGVHAGIDEQCGAHTVSAMTKECNGKSPARRFKLRGLRNGRAWISTRESSWSAAATISDSADTLARLARSVEACRLCKVGLEAQNRRL